MKAYLTAIAILITVLAITGCGENAGKPKAIPQIQGSLEGEHEIGNGGGLGEKIMLAAYANLSKYLAVCYYSRSCHLTSSEDKLLASIYLSLPKERSAENQIRFASEKASPGFFLIDGQVRVARTGNDFGSTIFINVDLLYSRLITGKFSTLSLPMAVAILIHELGHHHGVKDHEALDILASKVQTVLENDIAFTKTSITVAGEKVTLEANFYQLESNQYILTINNEVSFLDVSEQLREKACALTPSSSLVSGFMEVKSLSFPYYNYNEFRRNSRWVKMQLDTYVQTHCSTDPAVPDEPHVIQILFDYDTKTGQILLR